MGDFLLDNQATPSTPASGKSVWYPDSTTKRPVSLQDGGLRQGLLSKNVAIASQGAGFASDTYVTNSGILIPSHGMEAGQVYRWTISLSKSGAGTAAAVYTFRIGPNQTTADTARLALTATVAQTAAVSQGLLIAQVSVRNVGASGVLAGGVGIASNSAGLGGGIDGVAAGFDNQSLGGQYLGLSINGGASAAWTLTSVACELIA